MKIGKWKINFSKLIVFVALIYVVRVVEFAIKMMKITYDLSPMMYLLPSLLAIGGWIIKGYFAKATKENVPWNEWQARSQYENMTDYYEEENYNYNESEEI